MLLQENLLRLEKGKPFGGSLMLWKHTVSWS